MVGDADERRLEEAAGFARTDHRDVEDAEDLGMALEGVGQRAAGLDVLAHVDERRLELLGLGLLLEHPQGAQQRQAGRHHGGKLARHHHQVV